MKNLSNVAPLILLLIVVSGCAEQPKTLEWQKAKVIAENLDHPSALKVDGDFLYFVTGGTIAALDAGTAGVWRVASGGGEPVQLFKARRTDDGKAILPETFSIATDDKYVYWSSGTLWRTPKTGGASKQLAAAAPTELALDDKRLYWINFAGENSPPAPIYSAEKESQTAVAITEPIHSSGIVVDDLFVYWTQNDGIYKMAKNGGGAMRIYAAPEKYFTSGLAGDEQSLYFTVGDGRNSLMKITKTGADPLTLAPAINIAYDFQVAGRSVYFILNDGTFETAVAKVDVNGGEVVRLDGGYLRSFCVGEKGLFVADITKIYALEK